MQRGSLIALALCAVAAVAVAEPMGGGPLGVEAMKPPKPAGTAPAMPAAWKALPPIAAALAGAAAADGVTVDSADAWGDPALGCYAVQLAIHGGSADSGALATQIVDGLGGRAAGDSRLSFSEVVRPSDSSDVLSVAFARPPYRGRLRARLGAGRITALACFGNQRDPARCGATCDRMMQGSP